LTHVSARFDQRAVRPESGIGVHAGNRRRRFGQRQLIGIAARVD
jgi:hypothetical protein